VLFANNIYRDTDSGRFYPTDLLYLHFKTTTPDVEIDSVMQAYSLEQVATLYGDHYIRIARTTRTTPLDVITTGNRLFESGLLVIARASFCLPFETFSSPNDPYYGYQWNLKNNGSGGGVPGADIHLEEALKYYIPSTPLVVGIIDDGFESHPDFPAGRIIGGWDYYGQGDADIRPGRLKAHGMGCMGVIGALTNNGEGIAGIAPSNIQIVGQKIFADSCPPYPLSCAASEANIALAFDSCRIKGAKLISNSWGSTSPTWNPSVINEAIRRTDSAGVVIVFSSGNCIGCTWVGYPARLPQVLAVGATNRSDQRWNYSMYGPELDVVAPSGDVNLQGDIWTLDRTGSNGYNPSLITCSPQNTNYDCKFGGTSAACPEVAGIIALLLLRQPELIGQTEAIRSLIKASCDDQVGDAYDTPGWDQYYGSGRVNALKAMVNSCNTCGDADNSGVINVSDVVFLIAYIFSGGPVPGDCSYWRGLGDANGDGTINISDAVYL
jgi:serine protease